MCDAPDTATLFFPPGFTGPSPQGNAPRQWGPRKKLCSRTGYNLCIAANGKVYGTHTDTDQNANLLLNSPARGVVSIKGEEAGLFLAFSDKGRLQAVSEFGEDCLFEEQILPSLYNVYKSQKYANKKWYIAINRRGKVRNGKKTAEGKKSCHFLPRESTESE